MTTPTTEPPTAPRRAAGFGLRPRVLGWYALLLGLALALTSVVTFQQADQAQRQYVDDELREEIVDFEAAIAAGRADGLRPREAIDSYLDTWPVADRDTLVVRVGSSPARAEGPLGADPALVAAVDAAQGPSLSSLDTEQGEARVLATILRVDGNRVGGALAARPIAADRAALVQRRVAVLGATAFAFLLASGIAWITLGRLLRPVSEMAETAEAIATEGDLTRRIHEPGRRDEVGALATTFNAMLGRLEAAFLREQRFIREASHELRTPITICRGHLEVLGADPDPEDVREAIAVVVDELGRMGRIVEDMTTLSRVGDPGFLRIEPILVDELLGEVTRTAEPLLDGRLTTRHAPDDAVLRGDRQRIKQALINLLQNAALHARGDGPVELRAVSRGPAWRMEVADHGGGIPAGEEERLFRPFNRGRSTSPGSGLGLAIVRGIAEAHRGTAGVDNRPGDGATFWIEVPA